MWGDDYSCVCLSLSSFLFSSLFLSHTHTYARPIPSQVVVGTTAITGKQVGFQNLGLVVVDEEQRLGVGQKEKLKVRAWGMDISVWNYVFSSLRRAQRGLITSCVLYRRRSRLTMHTYMHSYIMNDRP